MFNIFTGLLHSTVAKVTISKRVESTTTHCLVPKFTVSWSVSHSVFMTFQQAAILEKKINNYTLQYQKVKEIVLSY